MKASNIWIARGKYIKKVSSYYKDVKHVLSYAPDAHMKMPFNAIVRIFFSTGNLFNWL